MIFALFFYSKIHGCLIFPIANKKYDVATAYQEVQQQQKIPVDGAQSARGEGPERGKEERGKIETIYGVGAPADGLSSLGDICNEVRNIYTANFLKQSTIRVSERNIRRSRVRGKLHW